METMVIHLLNALLYSSVLFLIAGGLSLIYGVMRIVNLAHGNLYAFGAYVSAWTVGLVAAGAPTAVFCSAERFVQYPNAMRLSG